MRNITDGLIPLRQERMLGRLRQATIKEYGASFLVKHLSGDIIELLKCARNGGSCSLAALRLLHNAHIKNLEFHYETSYLSELIPDADLSERHVGSILRRAWTESPWLHIKADPVHCCEISKICEA